MKHLFYGTLLAFLLVTPAHLSAQTTAKPAVAPKSAPQEQLQAPETLLARQTRVATELRDILTRLTLIHARTATAVDHLNSNSIATVRTDKSLDDAAATLTLAKTAIDSFAGIAVTETTPAATALTTTALRDAAQKSEEALKAARASLIDALTQLKTTVAADSTQE